MVLTQDMNQCLDLDGVCSWHRLVQRSVRSRLASLAAKRRVRLAPKAARAQPLATKHLMACSISRVNIIKLWASHLDSLSLSLLRAPQSKIG